ncbi:asparagine synthetase [glutamine-hydrolyzing]-like [Biomphalaria glabrata]|uniref:Asparagine synthetase [glutamine-hydrolyzing] n=1 Tax=Biomphalaria glabrata TaxID=6526 RepID=A0A9W2Z7W4_BIOGL|nr:asparagine synthetase [glutamine-hydrolyzing]-like [Biomphalaria glabrata]XP_055871083.1 asparagine synthetase [glutamine-hydrolyzing]-like [Biomphalaria glabrata]
MCGIWAVFGSDDNVSVQCNAVHKIAHRGPDAFRIENINHLQNCCLGFHRLAIVDDIRGMQPMRLYTHPYIWLIYNGEIYNHRLLDKEFNLVTSTDTDGEPIIHLYEMLGAEQMAKQLDGVFAFCILDTVNRKVILGRDTYGIRPLFRFQTDQGFLAVCSEAKGLFGLTHSLSDDEVHIEPFPPGHVEIYNLDKDGRAFLDKRIMFNQPGQSPAYKTRVDPSSLVPDVKTNIKVLLQAAVEKRLMADRRIGCLLSGGLDSSLVAALLVKLTKEKGINYPIQTFAIGLEGSPDLVAAKKVADFLGTEHHEVLMTPEEGLEAIESVIYHLESYDITTVRASVGMFLLSKYIKEKTDTTVILSGEGSDELAQGYIYFHRAPSATEGDKESRRLLNDLYYYDVLRGDRTTAAWGLEIRVPFLDHQFTSYYLSIDPELRQPKEGIEKYLLRSAFSDCDLLPNEILWRPKEAFSDGISSVSRSWYQIIQDHCNEQINKNDLAQAATLYPHNTPKTSEALYYRRIFEKYYAHKSSWIPYFWMPKWSGDTTDPSARTLKHYKQ